MDKEIVVRLHASFEDMVRKHADSGVEYWCARDLQMLLGYAKWENFAKVIDKAITACETSNSDPRDHFADIRKMVDLGSGAKREVQDIALTRYAGCHACILVQACRPSNAHSPRWRGSRPKLSHAAVDVRRSACLHKDAGMAPSLGAFPSLAPVFRGLAGRKSLKFRAVGITRPHHRCVSGTIVTPGAEAYEILSG